MKLLQINGGLSFTYCQTFYSTKNHKQNISKGMNSFTFYLLT